MIPLDSAAGESTGPGCGPDPAASALPPVASRRAAPVTPGGPAVSASRAAGGTTPHPALAPRISGLPGGVHSSSLPLDEEPREAAARTATPAGGGLPSQREVADPPLAGLQGADWRKKVKAATSAHNADKRRSRIKRAAKRTGPGMIRREPPQTPDGAA